MKKTLLVTLDYPPMVGGVAHYYANVAQNLPHERISVLDNSSSQLLFRYVWPRWLKGLWSVFRQVRRQKIEHILVGQVLPVGTIALLLKRLFGIPYTVMTHAMDITIPFGPEGSARKQRLVKKVLAGADSVTTVSTYTKKQLTDLGVPENTIELVYPCPHVSQTSAKSTEDTPHTLTGKKIVLVVARLVERKGIDTAIEAMALVSTQHKDAQLIIVGEGNDKKRLQGIVKKNELEHHVTFVGAVSPEELAAWYERCDLLVMPSRELSSRDVEGFGIVFLEAAVFGKPVIGGNSGGVPDAIVDGHTGFLVDPHSKDEVADRIIQILDDPSLAQQLGQAGRKRVEEQFQWSVQIKKIEKLLQ